jgi:Protein-L-isoaspartate(D-aspartate) O-methyltransferase (PCMT)
VVCGDGALGFAALAPYDRMIVTAGAWDISAGWWQQLAVGGRLVVPLRLHGSDLTRSIAFDLKTPAGWSALRQPSAGSCPCASLGLVAPARRWAGATLYHGDTIAYVATRPVSDDTDELGVIAHGPNSNRLAGQAVDLLDRWSQERPAQPTITAYPSRTPCDTRTPGARVIRPDTVLTIEW